MSVKKNHKRHLKEKHPEANPGDQKDNKSQNITTIYSNKRKNDVNMNTSGDSYYSTNEKKCQ